MKYNIFSTLTLVLGRFFMDPDIFRIGSGFLPIRIRTQRKKADPDPEKTRIWNTDFSHSTLIIKSYGLLGVSASFSLEKNYEHIPV